MKHLPLYYLALLAVFFATPACSKKGMLNVGNIRGATTKVLNRHDSYHKNNSVFFNQSKQVRLLLQEKEVAASELRTPLSPCMDRHDQSVRNDSKLKKVQVDVYLRSTKLLREILMEALKE